MSESRPCQDHVPRSVSLLHADSMTHKLSVQAHTLLAAVFMTMISESKWGRTEHACSEAFSTMTSTSNTGNNRACL